ncbi:MAG: sulfatase-like hydrolase/transferase, partial [Verrucomicrobiae bacterium]|nr:sulfatase-like hydrolase/transferase [Verrucomicrobiae bacterium]
TGANTSLNTPLRGFKAQTWEGGVHVPFLVKWKGRLPAGKVYEQPVAQLDVLPTALAAAGVAVEPEWKLDGMDLLPYVTGQKAGSPHDALYWRFGAQLAVRKGDWKLVKAAGGNALRAGNPNAAATTDGAELYHLGQDIGEQTNLASREPEKFRELADAWNRWNAELIEPAWRGGGGQALISNARQQGPWKKGDRLSSEDAPQVGGRALQISARVGLPGDGVIVAQGANQHGYALYLHDGKLAFAVRASGELTVVETKTRVDRQHFVAQADLANDGRIRLSIDGQTVAEGRAPGLIPDQPGDGFTVGSDANGAVGEYASPNPFPGEVEDVRVLIL